MRNFILTMEVQEESIGVEEEFFMTMNSLIVLYGDLLLNFLFLLSRFSIMVYFN